MCRVQLGVVMGDPVEEVRAREPAELILGGEPVEDPAEARLDVLGQREQAVVLRDRDRPQLARPRVDVGEDPALTSSPA